PPPQPQPAPQPGFDADSKSELEKPRPAATNISLEETLSTRLMVWVGSIALALGGIFLVRYFAQQGFFGPMARVMLAGAFGATLLGIGEWLRNGQARIAQGLTAA